MEKWLGQNHRPNKYARDIFNRLGAETQAWILAKERKEKEFCRKQNKFANRMYANLARMFGAKSVFQRKLFIELLEWKDKD